MIIVQNLDSQHSSALCSYLVTNIVYSCRGLVIVVRNSHINVAMD